MSPTSHLLAAFGGVIATSLLVVIILGRVIEHFCTRPNDFTVSNPFKVTVRYCKRRSKLKQKKSEEKRKMRELLFGNSPNNWTPPKPIAAPPTYQHAYSTPVYHHQLDNYNGFNPTMRYSMRSERGLPIRSVFF